MTPIFDREGEHVGWVSGDGDNVFDAGMNWIGYIDHSNAWSAANWEWVGPVIDGNFYDRSGQPIAWTNEGVFRQPALKKPIAPLKPFKPLIPKTPEKPGRRAPPVASSGGGWSRLSFRAAFT
jgi:hypothetical protein